MDRNCLSTSDELPSHWHPPMNAWDMERGSTANSSIRYVSSGGGGFDGLFWLLVDL